MVWLAPAFLRASLMVVNWAAPSGETMSAPALGVESAPSVPSLTPSFAVGTVVELPDLFCQYCQPKKPPAPSPPTKSRVTIRMEITFKPLRERGASIGQVGRSGRKVGAEARTCSTPKC